MADLQTRYLERLAELYPTVAAASTEVINLEAILNLPQAYMYSTAGMIRHASRSDKKQFIIATEIETIHKLKNDNPDKEFIPVHPKTICGQMKKVTLESVQEALEKEQYVVEVAEDIRQRAWAPIERMLQIK